MKYERFSEQRKKDSVTRWPDYFSIFDNLRQENVAQKHNNFAKVGSKYCRTLYRPSTI